MVKIVLSTLIFILATKAQAFTLISQNSNQKGWASNEITFNVNTANCPIDVVSLVSDAVAVWNDVANSNIKVSYAGSTASTSAANPTTVYCETNFTAQTGADDDFVPAAAIPSISNGTITAGLIYLNASSGDANIGNFDHNVMTIVLAHEIGHILGLGHSSDQNALMYYDGSYRNTLSLAQDDVDGISYLYPSNELGGDKMLGCAMVGKNLPPPPPRNLWLLAFLMLLPIAILVSLRNRKFLK